MDHVRIATYAITSETFQDVAAAAEEGMLRTFRDKPGFIRYGLADVGDLASSRASSRTSDSVR
jgi:hypothetical protein